MEKKDENKKGVVESFLGGMPLLGGFFKELAKTETFKERLKEADEKIEENLRKGEKKKWGFEANIFVRPIINEIKKEKKDTAVMFIGDNCVYGKKGDKLVLEVKTPKKEVDVEIKGKNLFISSDNFEKKIELPEYFRTINKKKYRKGILMLELTK